MGQTKSAFNVREIMDGQKILIMNLAKGAVGEEGGKLLGAMMITKIQLAAMLRVDIPQEQRKDFYLYVDEFQNYATKSFTEILSEARKYRLNLIMAHQYTKQLEEPVRDAVFGNVGTMVSFRVGAHDARLLQCEMPKFKERDFTDLNRYDIYVRLMINGVASQPFSATTLPPIHVDGDSEKVVRVSRERWAKRRDKVEGKIKRWISV